MKLRFELGLGLDGGSAWRHALKAGALAGWHPTGIGGMSRRLAKVAGLGLVDERDALRAAAWAERMRRLDDGRQGWSASFAVDPVGVARSFVELRDRLILAGWDGRPLDGSTRLRAIQPIEALGEPAMPPGVADLVVACAAADLPPVDVRLWSPRGFFAPRVRALLLRIEACGGTVMDPPADVPADGDLKRVREALDGGEAGELIGDGTVAILEGDTCADAAELTAVWIGQERARTVVAGVEIEALDAALRRRGLAPLGVSARSALRAPLQVLPLRLALCFAPRDPEAAFELLTLVGGPLERWVRRGLAQALQKMPGLWGSDWNRAVGELEERGRQGKPGELDELSPELAAMTGDLRAAEIRAGIERWFGGPTFDPEAGIPAAVAAAECEQVAKWAFGRARGDDEQKRLYEAAGAVAHALRRMLLVAPDRLLQRVELEQMHTSAVGSGVDYGGEIAGAGRCAVANEPAAVLAGGDEAIWWGFLDGGGRIPRFSTRERAALAAAGVELPGPGEERRIEAWGWERPFRAARRVVLVRWRLHGRERSAPHPLEDELVARFGAHAIERLVVRAEAVRAGNAPLGFDPARVPRVAGPQVRPRPIWELPRETVAVAPEEWSYSQLDTLLRCPLRWTLQKRVGLREEGIRRLPSGPQLAGEVAHRVIGDVLLDPAHRTDLAAVAHAAFEKRVQEAAPLVQPGAEIERGRVEREVIEGLVALVRILTDGGWTAVAVEKEVSGEFAGMRYAGRADLVLERDDGMVAVLDLKRGRLTELREELSMGRALQLGLYGRAMADGEKFPATGYFVVSQRILTTGARGAFPGADERVAPPIEDAVLRAEREFREWWIGLQRGLVAARHHRLNASDAYMAAVGDFPPSSPEPKCEYCEFQQICTVSVGERS